MSDNLARIEALVPDFQYVDSDHNRIVLTVGFSVSFYFWGVPSPEVERRGEANRQDNAVVIGIDVLEIGH